MNLDSIQTSLESILYERSTKENKILGDFFNKRNNYPHRFFEESSGYEFVDVPKARRRSREILAAKT